LRQAATSLSTSRGRLTARCLVKKCVVVTAGLANAEETKAPAPTQTAPAPTAPAPTTSDPAPTTQAPTTPTTTAPAPTVPAVQTPATPAKPAVQPPGAPSSWWAAPQFEKRFPGWAKRLKATHDARKEIEQKRSQEKNPIVNRAMHAAVVPARKAVWQAEIAWLNLHIQWTSIRDIGALSLGARKVVSRGAPQGRRRVGAHAVS